MTLVVDASVALKWFVAEPDSPQAEALVASGEPLVAPVLVVAEVCNGLWRRWRRGELSAEHFDEAAPRIAEQFDTLAPVEALAARAAALARALDHPIYDCLYLALAERDGAALVTADARLLAAAAKGWAGRARALGALAP